MPRSPLHFVVPLAVMIAACALAPSALPAAPVPKHLLLKDDLFCYAMCVGDRYEFVQEDMLLNYVVTEAAETKEGLRVRLEQEAREARRIHAETVILSARGVKVVEYNGTKLDPPFWWVKLPHEEENSWADAFGEQTWTGKTVGWEEVKVPAGTFRAIHVQHIEPKPRGITSYWFAPGIGCIKWESALYKREMTVFKPRK